MIGVDTNVLARLIAKDDLRQMEEALAVIRAARKNGHFIYVSQIVLCELSWLLRSRYKFTKQQVTDALENIILGKDFVIEERDIVHEVFDLYRQSKADFADILMSLRNQKAGCKHTLTFDASAKKVRGMKKLG